MGIFDWLFGQKQIDPQQVPLQTDWALPVLMDWIFSGFQKKPDGGYDLTPMPQYPGQLSPDLNSTILPEVWNMWKQNQTSPAMNFMQNFLKEGGYKLPEAASGRLENLMATGGQGGRPTEMMYDMANYGGVAGPNLEAIKAMMEYGAPSQAGQFMSNIAQFGIPSEAGRMLHNRAMGAPTPAQQYLAGYAGYGAPLGR